MLKCTRESHDSNATNVTRLIPDPRGGAIRDQLRVPRFKPADLVHVVYGGPYAAAVRARACGARVLADERVLLWGKEIYMHVGYAFSPMSVYSCGGRRYMRIVDCVL